MVDEAYLARAPKQQHIYKVMVFIMSMAGVYWYEWWGYKFPKLVKLFLLFMYYTVMFFVPTCITLQLMYIYEHWSEIAFATHGTIFTLVPLTMLNMGKVISAQLRIYKDLMGKFLNEIHLYNFRSNLYMKQMAIQVEKYTRYLYCFFFIFVIMDWALWTMLPIAVNLKNSEAIKNKTIPLKTCFYMWMPFDYEYEYKYWVLAHIINSVLIAIGCSVVIAFDTISYFMIFHLIGHIKSLKYLIDTNVSENLNDNEMKQKLIELIRYHCFVINIFQDIENVFGFNVTGNYLFNLVADSLLLYYLMLGETGNQLLYGFMFVTFMGGLIIMSLILEEVRRQTDDIPRCVYDLPWEKMSIPNQKIVLIMLARTQPTLEYISAGGLRAGINPTIQIIKSTFSYYVMLKSSL